jgi:hypothetical protein
MPAQAALETSTFRPEPLESRDYFVCDKIVYGCNIPHPKFRPLAGAVDWFSEYRAGHAWFKCNFTLHGQWEAVFDATIKFSLGKSRRSNVRPPLKGSDAERLMLVNIAKMIQLPEAVRLRGIPSRVWLKRTNLVNGQGGNVLHTFNKSFLTTDVILGMDRETRVVGRSTGGQSGKLPSQMIQRGAKHENAFPEGNRDVCKDTLPFDGDDMAGIFNIVLFRDGVWVGSNILTDQLIEPAIMFCRSLDSGNRK